MFNVDLTPENLDSTIVNLLPEHVLRNYQMIPVEKNGNKLVVAMSMVNLAALDDITMMTGLQVRSVKGTAEQIEEALNHFFPKSNF